MLCDSSLRSHNEPVWFLGFLWTIYINGDILAEGIPSPSTPCNTKANRHGGAYIIMVQLSFSIVWIIYADFKEVVIWRSQGLHFIMPVWKLNYDRSIWGEHKDIGNRLLKTNAAIDIINKIRHKFIYIYDPLIGYRKQSCHGQIHMECTSACLFTVESRLTTYIIGSDFDWFIHVMMYMYI